MALVLARLSISYSPSEWPNGPRFSRREASAAVGWKRMLCGAADWAKPLCHHINVAYTRAFPQQAAQLPTTRAHTISFFTFQRAA
jgi:hypothetical protein